MHDPHFKTKIFIGITAVIVLAIGIFLLDLLQGESEPLSPGPIAAVEIPPYTEETAQLLAASTGFQYLVSYTGSGFEPADLRIKKGETVRFTNNSSGSMWIAARGSDTARIYPGAGECGQSAFDMCKSVGSGEFWEFTFDKAGEWGFRNFEDTSVGGTITVQ